MKQILASQLTQPAIIAPQEIIIKRSSQKDSELNKKTKNCKAFIGGDFMQLYTT